MNKQAVLRQYQNYLDKDGLLIRSMDLLERSSEYKACNLTPFLSPDLIFIINKVADAGVSMLFFGGYEGAERLKVLFYPSYMNLVNYDPQISAIRLKYNPKFSTLTHRDVLGSLMSLGIERYKIGDILVREPHIDVILDSDIKDYVMNSLTKIKKTGITKESICLNDLIVSDTRWRESNQLVSSLRLDAVIAAGFNLSRKEALTCIESDRVKLNYQIDHSPSSTVKEGDLLSVRGKGRLKLIEISGISKKNKIKVKLGHLI